MTSPSSSHAPDGEAAAGAARVRLDRWLWAARFFKTRALAKTAIESGKVLLLSAGGHPAESPDARGVKPKPSREIASGDRLLIRRGETVQTVRVLAVDERRGSASLASRLFEETPESVVARESERAQRQLERAGLRYPAERPDKRERRERMKLKHAAIDGNPGDPSSFEPEQP